MGKANVKYYMYIAARAALNQSKRLVPNALIPSTDNTRNDFSIGITTYIERYEHYFKPLYKTMALLFPNTRITVAVNGFPDQTAQKDYLDQIESEICSKAPQHHRFILHDKPVGLTTLWNEILGLSLPLPVMILNDDLKAYPWLRRWAQRLVWQDLSLTLLNHTWSHFIISREVIEELGYFDPGFSGIGFEDMDYTALAGMKGIKIHDLACPYLVHRNHQPERTSFDSESTRVWGKYTSANQAYFFQKWEECTPNQGIYIRQLKKSVRPIALSKTKSAMPVHVKSLIDCNKKTIYSDRLEDSKGTR